MTSSTSTDLGARPTETESQSVVPASVSLPEITARAVVLAVVLAVILAAANAYLGLFAGMTVSASIPAAVVSMAVLRFFRDANILENNIVQTAASSGEALAAGVIFTIPSLLLVGYWDGFRYWETAGIALVGGTLGVLFTIPLRRALILVARLRFPEGVATAEVLKAGAEAGAHAAEAGRSLRLLVGAAGLGGLVKLGETGLRLWADVLEGAMRLGPTVLYGGLNLSPALLGVGFILGLETATVVVLGGAIGWLVLLPLDGVLVGVAPDQPAVAAARSLWSGHIRFVGIGAMVVGGLWTLVQLRDPVWRSLTGLVAAYRVARRERGGVPRTERDAPLPWVVGPFLLALIPMAAIYWHAVGSFPIALLMTLVMGVAAFLFASVAAYMAGLVGSSSNPVSGMTIATLMFAAILLVLLLGRGNPAGPAATLLVGAVVACAAAMGGDNLQDLKTGHLVGATPWKQQIMQVVGVAAGAVVIVPVLALLQAKYGIGVVTPEHPHPLSAPQATLMASLARGVFGGELPWPLVGLGAATGTGVILLDRRLQARGSALRLPVLAVALGIYLPFTLSAAIFAGGCIAWLVRRGPEARALQDARPGLLVAAGLITGESLTGILLAVPIGLKALWPGMSAEPFALYDVAPLGAWPGVLAVVAVAGFLYRSASRARSVVDRQ